LRLLRTSANLQTVCHIKELQGGGKDIPHCQPMAVGIHTLIALGEQPGAAVPDSTGKNQGV